MLYLDGLAIFTFKQSFAFFQGRLRQTRLHLSLLGIYPPLVRAASHQRLFKDLNIASVSHATSQPGLMHAWRSSVSGVPGASPRMHFIVASFDLWGYESTCQREHQTVRASSQ
jgi:hypothetical protein